MAAQVNTKPQILPHSKSWTQKLFEKWVINALKQMRAGFLKLTLPDGQSFYIGQSASAIHADINIHHPDFFKKVILYGHIGFGESYIDGDWDTTNVESVISWAILNVEQSPILEGAHNKAFAINLLGSLNRFAHWLRPNSILKSRQNIAEHYDLSNDFFKLFLDPTMTYSSAKFEAPGDTLEEGQRNKYESLCQKLRLTQSDHLLEIGTGWGGFALYAAKKYGCQITTVTISEEQYRLATQKVKDARLDKLIAIELKDYRKLEGQFDKIVSIEMIEAVGDQYMDQYIGQCAQLLKPNGLFAIQMITCPDSRYELLKSNVDFIQKHIFPGSLLPSVGRVNKALNKTSNLSLFELEDMGLHYATTLRFWQKALNQNIDHVKQLGFDTAFIRKWHYYFLYCAAAFQMRNISVVQAVYTRPNNLTLNRQAKAQ